MWTLDRVAAVVGGTVAGNGQTEIAGLAGVDTAEVGDLVFAETPKFLELAIKSRAVAVLTRAEIALSAVKPLILVSDPRIAFLKALEAFAPTRDHSPGVHPSAQIGENVVIGEGTRVAAFCTIGSGVVVGIGADIMEGVHVGAGCSIGDETAIYPNVVLYPRVSVGRRCIIHSGTVIGADGFGYAQVGNRLTKIPHIGTVRIEDDVEVGANCCIDRAKTAATIIGAGTKIDNLVHIAHNVQVGKSCILVSQVGIAGSTILGDGVILAGQVGVVDHLKIGDGAQVGAQSGVRYDIPAGEKYFGSPALPLIQRMRDIANANRLGDALRQIKLMEKRLATIESQLVSNPQTDGNYADIAIEIDSVYDPAPDTGEIKPGE
jgi:UDP-3-O-[3-hydroxymyristoyl] glucosamine N-acyltransferase